MSSMGFSQHKGFSKYLIDEANIFSCNYIIYSEKSDTVIFKDNVIFHNDFIQIDSVEKVLLIKKTKLLIIESSNKGTIILKHGMKIVSEEPLINNTEINLKNRIEYTLGDNKVYRK
jgi:hypothetical protein